MYEKIGWENSPSTQTPINATNLNKMDNGIERANKGIVFSYSATFTADGVVKSTTYLSSLYVGEFATGQTDIVTVFVANNVTSINGGAFANCTSLKTIYIDNIAGNITILSSAIPDGVNIVYCNDDSFINVNDLLANAIKSLKTKIVADEEQHKADTTTLSQAIQSVKESAIEEIAVLKETVSDLDKNKVNNIDFNNYKTTNDTAVAKKFDSANIESGTGNLYDQQGNIVATFDYTKILNAVTIQLCIQNLSTTLNYVYCYGMPFTISNKNMFRYYTVSNKDNAFKIAFENNHAHIKKINGNFSDGEIVTTSISYLL